MLAVYTSLDYPSCLRGGWGPPEPVLLDTCAVQHLALVFELADEHWAEEAVAELRRRCSPALAAEVETPRTLFRGSDHLEDDGGA